MSKHPPIIIRDETLRRRVIGMIERLDLSKGWEVVIQPHKRRRSLSQNSLYWKWLGEVAAAVSRHTGYTEQEIHDFLKDQFLPAQTVQIGGRVTERRTTTTLTTAQMSEFMDRVYAWATGELGVLLPLPDEFLNDRRAA